MTSSLLSYICSTRLSHKMVPIVKKVSGFYNAYALGVLTVGYILGELGHYLIGVTSKQTAIELDYGDKACQLNNTMFTRHELPKQCAVVKEEERYAAHLAFILLYSFFF